MTAYLQPGDKIHIAFPISANIGETLPEASRRMHGEIAAMYAQMNVQLIGSSGNTTLNHPVIVAVIREPMSAPIRPQGTDSLIPRRYRSAEKLGLKEDPPLPWQGGLDLEPDLPGPEATEPLPAHWDPLAPKNLLQ